MRAKTLQYCVFTILIVSSKEFPQEDIPPDALDAAAPSTSNAADAADAPDALDAAAPNTSDAADATEAGESDASDESDAPDAADASDDPPNGSQENEAVDETESLVPTENADETQNVPEDEDEDEDEENIAALTDDNMKSQEYETADVLDDHVSLEVDTQEDQSIENYEETDISTDLYDENNDHLTNFDLPDYNDDFTPEERSNERVSVSTDFLDHNKHEPGFDLTAGEIYKLKLWPDAQIPYFIDTFSFSDKVLRDKIRSFLSSVNSLTDLNFIELPSPPNDDTRWVFFINRRGLLGCADHSIADFTNEGVQHVVLGYHCLSTEGELAEAVLAIAGVPPQHNAPDRDDYVKIKEENIMPEKKYLFQKLNDNEWLFHDLDYDFESAGHYNSYKYSVNGQATIELQKKVSGITIGEAKVLSPYDIQKIRMLYNYIAKDKLLKAPDCHKLFEPGKRFKDILKTDTNMEPRPKPYRYTGKDPKDIASPFSESLEDLPPPKKNIQQPVPPNEQFVSPNEQFVPPIEQYDNKPLNEEYIQSNELYIPPNQEYVQPNGHNIPPSQDLQPNYYQGPNDYDKHESYEYYDEEGFPPEYNYVDNAKNVPTPDYEDDYDYSDESPEVNTGGMQAKIISIMTPDKMNKEISGPNVIANLKGKDPSILTFLSDFSSDEEIRPRPRYTWQPRKVQVPRMKTNKIK